MPSLTRQRERAKKERAKMNSRIKAAVVICALAIVTPMLTVSAGAMAATGQQKNQAQYACAMHPEVKSRKPGKCPKCSMQLIEIGADRSGAVEEAKKTDDVKLRLQIPNTPVYDQSGRQLNFYTDLVKGRTVAINFIFTTCTTICPPLAATFRKVQQQMGERIGRDIQLISVSVDPTTDVPERMNSFLRKFNAGPGWSFVSGSKPEIDLLLKSLGAYVTDKNEHTPMVLVGNDVAGYWTRAYGLAAPTEIVKVINEVAAKTGDTVESLKKPSDSASVSAQAVEVPLPGANKNDASDCERQVEKRVSSATTDAAPATQAAVNSTGELRTAKTPSEAAAAYFSNRILLTQENRPVRFYEDILKGKIVLINFFFTTCTGICPPMTANLLKVQEYLAGHVGDEVSLVSISVDPSYDTPERLKAYAASYKVKPGWLFLTGKKEDASWVLYRLGGYVEDKNDHSGILIIGDEATGHWQKIPAMTKPAQIADIVLKLIAAKKDSARP